DEPADDRPRAELIEREAGLRRERRAGEHARQQNDGQRAEPDQIELLDDVVTIERAREEAGERPSGEKDVLLHLERGLFQPALKEAHHAAVTSSGRATAAPAPDCGAA